MSCQFDKTKDNKILICLGKSRFVNLTTQKKMLKTSERLFNVLESKRGETSIARFMRSLEMDENIYHNIKRGRNPSLKNLKDICLKLKLTPDESYFILTGQEYTESLHDNTNDKNVVKKNLQDIAKELDSTVEQLKELVLELSWNKDEIPSLDLSKVNLLLEKHGYTAEQAVFLATVKEPTEKTLLSILKGEQSLSSLSQQKRARFSRLIVQILSIVTNQSNKELVPTIQENY